MLIPSVSTTHSNISETAAYSSISQAMARISSIVLAVACEYLEDDEEEVEAASELGLEVCSNFFVQRDAAPQLQTLPLEALPQIWSLQDLLLDEENYVDLDSLCSHAAAFPYQLRSVSRRYPPWKTNKFLVKLIVISPLYDVLGHQPLINYLFTCRFPQLSCTAPWILNKCMFWSYHFKQSFYSPEAVIAQQGKISISNSWINMRCSSGGTLDWEIFCIQTSGFRRIRSSFWSQHLR